MLEIKLDEMLSDSDSLEGIARQIRAGAILVYPTDTVYGIGCNAEDTRAVKKLRRIKGTEHPFSVIAPSREWIDQNLETKFSEYLSQLSGPITLIMRKKQVMFLENASKEMRLGVRLPDHPIIKLISTAGVPFITTSANRSGEPVATNPKDVPKEWEKEIDFIIDGGILSGKPSRVIDISGDAPIVLRE